MTAVWMLARAELRVRWAALLGLALIVAVVSAVVLTAAVGARRTATTLDRYRDWSASSDAGIQMSTEDQANDLAAYLRTLPFVDEAVTRYLVNGFPTRTDLGIADFAVYFDPHLGFGTTVDRVRMLSGRMPGPHATDEIALTELAASEMHVSIGDHLRASTFDATDLGRPGLREVPWLPRTAAGPDGGRVGAHARRASGHGGARQPVRLRDVHLRGRPSRSGRVAARGGGPAAPRCRAI